MPLADRPAAVAACAQGCHSKRRGPHVALALLLLATASLGAQQAPVEAERGIGSWPADSFGTQRAVLHVPVNAPAVRVHLPWRRADAHPDSTRLIVTTDDGTRISNVARVQISRAVGDLAFEPVKGDGIYYVYWLPYTGTLRANYPRITYPQPDEHPSAEWLAATKANSVETWRVLPETHLIRFESSSEFERTDMMELTATPEETAALRSTYADPSFVVFAETREHPIRLRKYLPARWTGADRPSLVTGTALRGEHFVYQLGVWAHKEALRGIAVVPGELIGPGGARIRASATRVSTLQGKDWRGVPFSRTIDVAAGEVRAIWLGVDIPTAAPAGVYEGMVTVRDAGGHAWGEHVVLTVSADTIVAHGDDDPSRLSRLRWLDSDLARDNGLVRPFTPVTVRGRTLQLLGRTLELGADGLPVQITSRFSPAMTSANAAPYALLASPVTLDVQRTTGAARPWVHGPLVITPRAPGAAEWRVTSRAGGIERRLKARLEFDGTIEYEIALTSRRAAPVGDVAVLVPLRRDAVRWFMGMGRKGGERPEGYEWNWDVGSNQDAAWAGDVHAGLQLLLKDDKYVRPLNTNFYTLKPLVMPRSWQNGGAGGCRFGDGEPAAWTMRCYSGPRTLAAGDTLHYDFRLTITPFKPIDPAAQFRTRFFHAYVPVDSIARMGANTVNVHHATAVNPWINYPFLETAKLKAFTDSVHAAKMRIKIYYTVRELTNHAPEIWALRAMDHEVFSPGTGGGWSWLQEHLGDDYIAAWHVPEIRDAAIITNGISRWHNFYVEGMDWLARNVGVDGIYIDDVAFDRITMQRVRKVLERHRPDPMIDLHSANQWNKRDGYASSMNLYLEHLPFVDRLWFGEYFDYDSAPDYWLVELSGIPFGTMGEMLEGGGNPWRGMLFGMTNRLPWSGDPRPLWKLFDEVQLGAKAMRGWWDPATPVTTGRDDVRATSYVQKGGQSLVAIASWAPDVTEVPLRIDWAQLGLSPDAARVRLIAVDGMQGAAELSSTAPIMVQPKQGALIVIEPR